MWSTAGKGSSLLSPDPQLIVALLIRAVALVSFTDRVITETRLDEEFDDIVRLNTNPTPGLSSLKIRPSGSDDVNSRVTLVSEVECSKSILHSNRVIELCSSFGTSQVKVWGCPRQKRTASWSCIDTADNVQADEDRSQIRYITTGFTIYLPESVNTVKQTIWVPALAMLFLLMVW